jgi:hypothetical protein
MEHEEEESISDLKRMVCKAGRKAAKELIKIAESEILSGDQPILMDRDDGVDETPSNTSSDLSADKITRAAQQKKIAVMDAFEILERVDREEAMLKESVSEDETIPTRLAESRAKRKK